MYILFTKNINRSLIKHLIITFQLFVIFSIKLFLILSLKISLNFKGSSLWNFLKIRPQMAWRSKRDQKGAFSMTYSNSKNKRCGQQWMEHFFFFFFWKHWAAQSRHSQPAFFFQIAKKNHLFFDFQRFHFF